MTESQVRVCPASRRANLDAGPKISRTSGWRPSICPRGRLSGIERARWAWDDNLDNERGCVRQFASVTTESCADTSTASLARTQQNHRRYITPVAM
jgi:hypothetical protein